MFKLKPGNVFQKINKMDKKQAYTWGAIVVVCFIALMTLASFMGDAEETSFDGFNTRGYDLAQMPFVNDEAEEYLLASKYPDMQNNGSTMLYSQEEKEARQEADAEAAADDAGAAETSSSEEYNTTNVYKSKGYTGGGRGAGAGTPTQVGTLGSASMGRSGGSGMSGTFGAPRGDFSPYKSQEKGSEIPAQLKNTDAKKALSQFARTSRAAAGLLEGKGGNAKRALMGGSIKGSEAFTETGVDLSKANGLALDTNAPTSSADLSNLDKKVAEGNKKAQEKKKEEDKNLENQFLNQFLSGLIDLGVKALGSMMEKGINAAFGAYGERAAFNNDLAVKMMNKKGTEVANMPEAEREGYRIAMGWGDKKYDTKWEEFLKSDNKVGTTFADDQRSFVRNLKDNKDSIVTSTYRDDNGDEQVITLGAMHGTINRAHVGGGNIKIEAPTTYTPPTTKVGDRSVSGNGPYKSPSDFHTQTQYENYVNGLDVDEDIKETLRKRKK